MKSYVLDQNTLIPPGTVEPLQEPLNTPDPWLAFGLPVLIALVLLDVLLVVS
jgi:hypothetical protein